MMLLQSNTWLVQLEYWKDSDGMDTPATLLDNSCITIISGNHMGINIFSII